MRLRLMDLVVRPPSRLLYAECAPLLLAQQLPLGQDLLVDLLGKHNVAVLVPLVVVLVGVLDFAGIVRHKNILFKAHVI